MNFAVPGVNKEIKDQSFNYSQDPKELLLTTDRLNE